MSGRMPSTWGIKCPECNSLETVVTRTERSPNRLMRRRACAYCGHKWFTEESNTDIKIQDPAQKKERPEKKRKPSRSGAAAKQRVAKKKPQRHS